MAVRSFRLQAANYYACTFMDGGSTFLSRKAFLGAPAAVAAGAVCEATMQASLPKTTRRWRHCRSISACSALYGTQLMGIPMDGRIFVVKWPRGAE
jgi:hypothetical protein